MEPPSRQNKTARTSNVTFNTDPTISCSHVGKSNFAMVSFFFVKPAAVLAVEVEGEAVSFDDADEAEGVTEACLGDNTALDDDDPEPVADATAAFRTSLGVGFGNGLLLGCVDPDGVGIGYVEGAGGAGGLDEGLPALPLPPAPEGEGEDVDATEV